MDRLLTNARLATGRTVDVLVADGTVSSVAGVGTAAPEGVPVDDLEGLLLLPAMAEPHAHIDKALTADTVLNPDGDLIGAVRAWAGATSARSRAEVARRAREALERLLVNGTTAVRTHCNNSGPLGAEALQALLTVRAEMAGMVDLQVVALPSTPLTGDAGAANRVALEEAIAAGVDLVGGAPHLDGRPEEATRYLVDIAVTAHLPLDLHTDETLDAGATGLRHLAELVIERGFEHGVTASHCVSLGTQPPQVQAETARLVAEAGIGVVALPQTNLYLQGRDVPTATPRGITAIAVLQEAGVTVAAGGDNTQDAFNLMGRSDPLEAASLLVTAAHRPPDAAYRMVSADAHRIMGVRAPEVAVGSSADLVAIDASSLRAAIADAPHTRRVYRSGRLVAESTERRTIHR